MNVIEDIILGSISKGVNVRRRYPCPSRRSSDRPKIVPSPALYSHRNLPLLPQKPTLALLNLSLCGCIVLLCSLVFGAGVPPDVLPHLVVLLFFALGLIISVNW